MRKNLLIYKSFTFIYKPVHSVNHQPVGLPESSDVPLRPQSIGYARDSRVQREERITGRGKTNGYQFTNVY